jgi:preprotein translocase subunit YajC
MNLFINQAMASGGVATQQSSLMSFLPLIVIFLIFYFLLIRPQQKRLKLQKEMWESLKISNKIVTSSGIFGKIAKINRKENKLDLEIAENTIITITLDSISNIIEEKKLSKKLEKKQHKKSDKPIKK